MNSEPPPALKKPVKIVAAACLIVIALAVFLALVAWAIFG
jgi:hypothetical protein